MAENSSYQDFIKECSKNKCVWSIEANQGMFAMLEDNNGQEYLPVWDSEEKAASFIDEDWDGYIVVRLSLIELINWLDELHKDEIMISINAGKDKKTIPVDAQTLKEHFRSL